MLYSSTANILSNVESIAFGLAGVVMGIIMMIARNNDFKMKHEDDYINVNF